MMRYRLGLWVLGLAACGPQEITGELEHEHPPSAEAIDYLRAGVVDCSRTHDVGYQSGSAYDIQLIRVDGKPIGLEAGDAYALMQAAAARDGVDIYVVSGFRTQAEQRYLYNCYLNCSCNQCNLAAAPGYSNHQSGVALDLNTHDPGVYSWLARNGGRFGFVRTVPSEDWHWEFYGPAPGLGPCRGGTPVDSGGLELNLRDGAAYTNGQTLRTEVTQSGVALIRYFADGYFLGVSEDKANDFPVRYVFSQLGRRRLEAVALDAQNREVARTAVNVTITAGATEGATLGFRGLVDRGWYTNGIDLAVDASAQVTRVVYFAGPHRLGESSQRATGFRVHTLWNNLGHRAVSAAGYGANGQELVRRSLQIRVMPGEESASVGPSVAFVLENGASLANGGLLKVVGSQNIQQIRLSADGYVFQTLSRGSFETRYRFSRTGTRNLLAEGLNAQGQPVARAEIRLTIQ